MHAVTEPLDQRVQIVIGKSQLRSVDDWRRAQEELPSRSEAIRRLIEIALTMKRKQT
jgi:metal-responsive CopG/Arc/MetJ family transcriptional regulator